jgi:hypothetical protein
MDLDTLLKLNEAARICRLSPREMAAKSKGKRAPLPGIWINSRVVRFHPRMMLAKAAYDAGVPVEVIAAAFNLKAEQLIRTPAAVPKPENLGFSSEPTKLLKRQKK